MPTESRAGVTVCATRSLPRKVVACGSTFSPFCAPSPYLRLLGCVSLQLLVLGPLKFICLTPLHACYRCLILSRLRVRFYSPANSHPLFILSLSPSLLCSFILTPRLPHSPPPHLFVTQPPRTHKNVSFLLQKLKFTPFKIPLYYLSFCFLFPLFFLSPLISLFFIINLYPAYHTFL